MGSTYALALERTVGVLHQRARLHRNHVIVVVVCATVVAVAAVVLRSLPALAGVLVLLPVSGIFFFMDAHALEQWRSDVFAAWNRGDLELAGLRAAVRAHTLLAPDTLEAMLATLPSTADLVAEQRIRPATRLAVSRATRAFHRERADAMLLNVGASAVAAVAVVGAIWLRSWTPLFAVALLLLRPPLASWMRGRRVREVRAVLALHRGEDGFSEPDYQRLVSSVGRV